VSQVTYSVGPNTRGDRRATGRHDRRSKAPSTLATTVAKVVAKNGDYSRQCGQGLSQPTRAS